MDAADALEGEVDAAVGQLDDDLLDGLVRMVLGVDELVDTKRLGQFKLVRVDVDADDARRARLLGAHGHGQADGAQTPDGHRRARLHLSRVQRRAVARRYAAAQQTHLVDAKTTSDSASPPAHTSLKRQNVSFSWYLVERGLGVDLGQGDLRHDRVLGEGGAAHKVVDDLALARETAGAVRHQALALRGADLDAQVRFGRTAELALAALRCVARDHVVA